MRNQIRQQMRHQRRSLSHEEQQKAAESLLRQLRAIPELDTCASLAAYLASDGEIDPAPFVQERRLCGTAIYLPAVHPEIPRSMIFRLYRENAPLSPNRFGIPEPGADSPASEPWELDAILVPLTAFDLLGNRLGMGGGYYDTALSRIASAGRHVLTIGIAHGFQQIPAIPLREWDVPLAMVVTPDRIFRFTDTGVSG